MDSQIPQSYDLFRLADKQSTDPALLIAATRHGGDDVNSEMEVN